MAFVIKQNDTRPKYVVQLVDNFGEPDQGPVDLTTATAVKLIMAAKVDGSIKVNDTAAITTPAQGIVTYTWDAADTDTVGEYDAEFEITWGDGGVETVPNDGYLEVRVTDDLG